MDRSIPIAEHVHHILDGLEWRKVMVAVSRSRRRKQKRLTDQVIGVVDVDILIYNLSMDNPAVLDIVKTLKKFL